MTDTRWMEQHEIGSYVLLMRDVATEKWPHASVFLRTHRISFAFALGEFLPNPDFEWPDPRSCKCQICCKATPVNQNQPEQRVQAVAV